MDVRHDGKSVNAVEPSRTVPKFGSTRLRPAPEEVAQAVLEMVLRVRESVQSESSEFSKGWNSVIALADFRPSAENLSRYLALRTHDLSELQPRLSALGLSSLGRCEGHVMANLDAVIAALSRICGAKRRPFPRTICGPKANGDSTRNVARCSAETRRRPR